MSFDHHIEKHVTKTCCNAGKSLERFPESIIIVHGISHWNRNLTNFTLVLHRPFSVARSRSSLKQGQQYKQDLRLLSFSLAVYFFEIAIASHIVAVPGLIFSSRCRGRPYAGRYQFYMTFYNQSDHSPSLERLGGLSTVVQTEKTASCMLTWKSRHLANHRISKFSSNRHWKLKSHLGTS